MPKNLNIKDLSSIQGAPLSLLLENFIPVPQGALSMIFSHGGLGKSSLSIRMSAKHVENDKNGKVLILSTEDPATVVKQRAGKMKKDDLSRIHLTSNSFLISSDNFEDVKEVFSPYDMVFIDPLVAFLGEDENDNSKASGVLAKYATIAKENDQAIIFIHHATKGSQGILPRGASAIHDAMRLIYSLKMPESQDEQNNGVRYLSFSKDNFGVEKHLKHALLRVSIAHDPSP